MNTFLKFYIPVLITTFFFWTLLLRTYVLYKKTKVNPLTFGRQKESAHDYVGSWFKVILLVVFVYGILNSFIPIPKISYLDNILIQAVGIVLTIASLIFTIYAQNEMGTSWRIGIDQEVKTQLVTTGPFAYIRNPIFLGMIVMLLGLFFLIPTYFIAVLFILSYLLINIQTRLEEEYLAKVHGNVYLNYKKGTGRFFPKYPLFDSGIIIVSSRHVETVVGLERADGRGENE
ncbi:methyltransferase family protein [Desulfitobacterium sp. Sab5]|uniref:methyltransferase family protein n=1 Tax=Desulfitobacterium nosdiversum TaxID=3375356 RepID=UPI003CF6EC0D